MTAEHLRLEEARKRSIPWKEWGPYLSERQWGTVREDYSEGGDAWNYFTHDQARSRAYRWGEDGLAGISDDQQRLCFALALWNGKDPILKERLFGLTNSESNHGEDVKEYYFYLDSTPTHSYMKYLYKYPQAAFPYADLVETSRRRGRQRVRVRAARHRRLRPRTATSTCSSSTPRTSPEDILIQITVHNRGPEAAELHVLPTLWFRNLWSWQGTADRPVLQAGPRPRRARRQGRRRRARRALPLLRGGRPLALHGERDQHASGSSASRTGPRTSRTASTTSSSTARRDAVNPEQTGTKAAAHYRLTVGPGECRTIRLRLSDVAPAAAAQGNGNAARAVRRPTSTRSSRRGATRRTSSTPPSSRPRWTPTRPTSCGRPWRGCSGASSSTTTTSTSGWKSAAPTPSRPTRKAAPAQRPLAPHVQRRRHLDAGQVGVSLVRGLGPRLPRPRPDARRPRFRQAAAQADAARAVHAPQRPDPGLRVELRRRQPAGPRLVHHLHLPPGKGAARARATGSGSRAASRSCC